MTGGICQAAVAEGFLWTSLSSKAPEEPACARHRRTPQTAVSKKLNLVRANQTLIKVSYIIVSNAARA